MRVSQIVFLLAWFAIGAGIAIALAHYRSDLVEDQRSDRPFNSGAADSGAVKSDAVAAPLDRRPIDPQEAATPQDVVQRQMESLRDASDRPDALMTCYRYASPRNRATIGAYENFARLLSTPKYRPLIGHAGRIIGQPEIRDDRATVLVTVIDPEGAAHAFRFWLQRQASPPNVACWMTDGVLPVGQQSRLDFPIRGSTHD